MFRGDGDILQYVYQWEELREYIGRKYALNLLPSAWCEMELKIHFSSPLPPLINVQLIHFRCWIFILLMPVFVWHWTSVRGILYFCLHFNFDSFSISFFAMQMSSTFRSIHTIEGFALYIINCHVPLTLPLCVCLFRQWNQNILPNGKLFTKLSPNYPKIEMNVNIDLILSIFRNKYIFFYSQSVSSIWVWNLECNTKLEVIDVILMSSNWNK